MGSELTNPPTPDSKPHLYIEARADHGTPNHPGVGLEKIQIIKGWVDAQGVARRAV